MLSACETQLGELSAGDEVVGLTRAFFFAGTPSVIATLWSVDDRPTALLMEHFYRQLRAGVSKAQALRMAQQEVRQHYPSPYYWAGFVLSGDAGAIQLTLGDRLQLAWPWLGGGSLLVGGAIVAAAKVTRRRRSTPSEQRC